jgi:hypothetical protein
MLKCACAFSGIERALFDNEIKIGRKKLFQDGKTFSVWLEVSSRNNRQCLNRIPWEGEQWQNVILRQKMKEKWKINGLVCVTFSKRCQLTIWLLELRILEILKSFFWSKIFWQKCPLVSSVKRCETKCSFNVSFAQKALLKLYFVHLKLDLKNNERNQQFRWRRKRSKEVRLPKWHQKLL